MQIMNMMRGGGKHRNKKNKAEKKPAASPRSQEPERGQQECDEEKIIQSLLSREETVGMQRKKVLKRNQGTHFFNRYMFLKTMCQFKKKEK